MPQTNYVRRSCIGPLSKEMLLAGCGKPTPDKSGGKPVAEMVTAHGGKLIDGLARPGNAIDGDDPAQGRQPVDGYVDIPGGKPHSQEFPAPTVPEEADLRHNIEERGWREEVKGGERGENQKDNTRTDPNSVTEPQSAIHHGAAFDDDNNKPA